MFAGVSGQQYIQMGEGVDVATGHAILISEQVYL